MSFASVHHFLEGRQTMKNKKKKKERGNAGGVRDCSVCGADGDPLFF